MKTTLVSILNYLQYNGFLQIYDSLIIMLFVFVAILLIRIFVIKNKVLTQISLGAFLMTYLVQVLSVFVLKQFFNLDILEQFNIIFLISITFTSLTVYKLYDLYETEFQKAKPDIDVVAHVFSRYIIELYAKFALILGATVPFIYRTLQISFALILTITIITTFLEIILVLRLLKEHASNNSNSRPNRNSKK